MTDQPDARQLELVCHAILAPSSHNTQCWRFRLGPDRIEVRPDWSRRCPVVDPDDHHLFVSLGCAVENLIQAAPALGWRAEARYQGAAGGRVGVTVTQRRMRNGHALPTEVETAVVLMLDPASTRSGSRRRWPPARCPEDGARPASDGRCRGHARA